MISNVLTSSGEQIIEKALISFKILTFSYRNPEKNIHGLCAILASYRVDIFFWPYLCVYYP